MTTEERLNKIKAKCEQLLAIAAKRTEGKWNRHEYECLDNVVTDENGKKWVSDSFYIGAGRKTLKPMGRITSERPSLRLEPWVLRQDLQQLRKCDCVEGVRLIGEDCAACNYELLKEFMEYAECEQPE